jgi:uncharacterized membrane protein
VTSEALYATFGRQHLAVLHFPVALLALAALFELLELRGTDERRAALVRTLARFGAVGAAAAALTGWIHADAEPLGRTVAETLDLHRWTGIATAVFALVAGWGSGLARRAGLFAAAFPLLSPATSVASSCTAKATSPSCSSAPRPRLPPFPSRLLRRNRRWNATCSR